MKKLWSPNDPKVILESGANSLPCCKGSLYWNYRVKSGSVVGSQLGSLDVNREVQRYSAVESNPLIVMSGRALSVRVRVAVEHG